MTNLVLWDVDTQVDFMLPDGKLYVRGAEQNAPAMATSSGVGEVTR